MRRSLRSLRPARLALAAFALGASATAACDVNDIDFGASRPPDAGHGGMDDGLSGSGSTSSGGGSSSSGGGGSSSGGSTADDDAGGADGGSVDTRRSSGCGKAGPAPGVTNVDLAVGGATRTYVLSVPAGYDPNVALPLVVGLHGTGDADGTPRKARMAYGVEDAAANQAVFVYPEARPAAGGPPGELRWDPDRPSPDFAFVTSLLDAVEAQLCVDRARVFAVGFSNGGRMAATLGCAQGDRFRGVAPVGPGGNEGTAPLAACQGNVAVWGGRGANDDAHLPGERLVLAYFPRANACAASTKPTTPTGCRTYDGCSGDQSVTWCSYPGAHVWPGFGGAAVWRFFDGLR